MQRNVGWKFYLHSEIIFCKLDNKSFFICFINLFQLLNIFTGFKYVRKLDLSQSIEKLKQIDEVNKEGFVVKFTEDNFRMKIKFPSYISLHKKSKKQSKKISEGCFDDFLDQMMQLSCEA